MNILQIAMHFFDPENKASLCKMNALACELGGPLVPPEVALEILPGKYDVRLEGSYEGKG